MNGAELLYADLAGLIEAGLPEPPAPAVLLADDGVGMFYAGQVNYLFGDPEAGKSWVALAAVVETLRDGGRAAVIDLDHNGAVATVRRLESLGADLRALGDLERFRYVEPLDAEHMRDVVADLAAWQAGVVVVDSLGELLPLFGASSNSPDDFTAVHAVTLKPLAMSGAAVIVIDHLAKSEESRKLGATGTIAKRRAAGGSSLRAVVIEPFAPGRGGAVELRIHKDRHGGLRRFRPSSDHEPAAGVFRMFPDGGWQVFAPAPEAPKADEVDRIEATIVGLLETTPAPLSLRAIRSNIAGKAVKVDEALTRLVASGRVKRTPGPRGAILHSLVDRVPAPREETSVLDPAGSDCVRVPPIGGDTGHGHTSTIATVSGHGGDTVGHGGAVGLSEPAGEEGFPWALYDR